MHTPHDPVDVALQAVGSSAWSRGTHEAELEAALLREFDRSGRVHRGRTSAVWIAAAAVLAGGAVFAATGGREALQKWLVRIHVIDAGGLVLVDELTTDGDGKMQVELPDGRRADVEVQVTSHDQSGETTKQVTVQVSGQAEDSAEHPNN